MLCILTIASSSMFENYIKLIIFAACFLSWQISHSMAACSTNWTQSGSSCYGVITNSTPFSNVYEARQSCLQEGGDLASIENSAIEMLIYALVLNTSQVSTPSYTYIGMTDISSEGTFTWLDGTANTYTNFSGSQPDNVMKYNGEDCVAIHSSDSLWLDNGMTSWVDVSCCFQEYNINSVACKKPLNDNITITMENDTVHQECFGGCPNGWYKYQSNCYGIVSSMEIFNSTYHAREKCQSVKADLPTVSSENISYHLGNILRQQVTGTHMVYIGLSDYNTEGNFIFMDGQPVVYSNWKNGYPSGNSTENCVIFESVDGLWDNGSNMTAWRDINCCNNQGISWVMCEKPESHDVSPVATDNNTFARECYGHFNECDSNPCQNGATCEDNVLYYKCNCLPGFTGINCETQIDYCQSTPCVNGATCITEVNAFNCSCTPGYNGTQCENLYDQCLAVDNCQNGATCVNHVSMAYSNCTCVPGFTGLLCETNIDECVNMTCLNNGTCIDGINKAHCNCLQQFSGHNCETELSCSPENPTVVNSTQITNIPAVAIPGKYITFVCDEGYKFPDMSKNKTINCTSNDWSPPVSTLQACEPHCASIPSVSNSVAPNPNTKVGTMLNYTCDIGYKLYNNNTEFNVTCLPSGNWSLTMDQIPQCEIVNCPELPVYPYQTLNKWNTTYNTTVTFWCDVGYVLHDQTTARTIKCLADGEWTATLPECQPITCPNIDQLSGTGWSRNSSKNTYNTYTKYTCNSGLRMRDGATYRIIKCDATGEWSDNITECSNDRCFPLPFVANATPSATDAMWGSEITLSCILGHRFHINGNKEASKVMKCMNISRWEPLLAACEPMYCDAVPGNVNSEPNTTYQLFGTVVEVKCDRGHYYPDSTNSVIMECIDNKIDNKAEWNITYIEPCWPTVCKAPPSIVNTNGTQLNFPSNYNYSIQIRYSCYEGYKFIDGLSNRTLECNELGAWNQTDVSCRKFRCDPIPTAFKAEPDTTNTSWTTVVTYKCALGYHWTDTTTYVIQCVAGDWKNQTTIPNCNINECPPVTQYPNVTTNSTDHVYNTVIVYECDEGFKYPDGTVLKTKICDHTKVWLPSTFPSCEIIHCPKLTDVENATRNTNNTEYNTIVTYDCDAGYQFPDKDRSKTVYCTSNETWTPFPQPCEVVFCPPIPYWDADFNSTDNNFLSVVTYKCQSGDAFEDSNKDTSIEKTAMCLESKIWYPPIGQCLPLDSIAKDLIGVTYDSEDAVSIGTIACSLMCVMMAAIILLDLNKIIEDLKMMKNNIESMMQSDNKVSDSSANIKDAAESTA